MKNGQRTSTEKARERVLKAVRRRGYITNRQAGIVGQWDQAWYHLDAMRQAGLLKHDARSNRWVAGKRL